MTTTSSVFLATQDGEEGKVYRTDRFVANDSEVPVESPDIDPPVVPPEPKPHVFVGLSKPGKFFTATQEVGRMEKMPVQLPPWDVGEIGSVTVQLTVTPGDPVSMPPFPMHGLFWLFSGDRKWPANSVLYANSLPAATKIMLRSGFGGEDGKGVSPFVFKPGEPYSILSFYNFRTGNAYLEVLGERLQSVRVSSPKVSTIREGESFFVDIGLGEHINPKRSELPWPGTVYEGLEVEWGR